MTSILCNIDGVCMAYTSGIYFTVYFLGLIGLPGDVGSLDS